MADLFKLPKLEPQPSGVLKQTLIGAVNVSGGAADAGKVVLLNSAGQIDPTMGGGGGSSVKVNSASVSNPNFNNTLPAAPGGFTNVIWQVDPITGNVSAYYATSGTEIQVNGIDTTAQTPVSFVDSSTIHVTNPSAGNIQFTLSPPMPTVPVTNAGALHEFFKSYDSTTGVFGLGQPAFTDISGMAAGINSQIDSHIGLVNSANGFAGLNGSTHLTVIPVSTAPTHQFAVGIAASGALSYAQPNYADIQSPPQLPQTFTPIFSPPTIPEFLTGYNAVTGLFSSAVSMEVQVNGVDALSQTPINFKNGTLISVTNPSAGNVKFDFTGVMPQTFVPITSPPTVLTGYDATTGLFAFATETGGTGTPGAPPNSVQYNGGGTFGGSANFEFNGTDTVSIKSKLNLLGSSSGTITVQGAAAAGTWTLTLPINAGSSGNLLSTDGAGVTSWVPSSGATPSRTTANITGSLDSAKITTGTVTLAKTFMLQTVASSFPIRVRLYSTSAANATDTGLSFPSTNATPTSDRPNTIPPTPGTQHGVICDLFLDTSDKYTLWRCSPAIMGTNDTTSPPTPSASIYYAITNLDTVTRSESVTLTFLPMES